MSAHVVRPRGVIYQDRLGVMVEALGVEVVAGADAAVVTSVGWTIESDTGTAQLVLGLGSRHPQPRLPHKIAPGDGATWMMTPEEIRDALATNVFGIEVDQASVVLRAFAKVNDARLESDETVHL